MIWPVFAATALAALADDSCDAQIFLQSFATQERPAGIYDAGPVAMTNFAGQMPSAVSPKTSCSQTSYLPSAIEKKFKLNAVQLTKDRHVLCGALKGTTEEWLAMNLKKTPATSKSDIFSQICPGPMATKQVIEPLVGLLRDPRFLCLKKPELFTFSVDWLVLADNKSFPSTTSSNSRRIFFDAGGSRFVDALNFFVTKYEERDIEMDQIYVWEMEKKNASQYWAGTPEDVRAKWEPRLTWYNGIPVSINEGDMHNPVHRIRELCRMGDFCAFKLDIDTPKVEGALVQQLLEDHGHLTEFFFEHHVQSHLMHLYWLRDINFDQNFEHSYDLFSALREKGLRAHSWI
mmetsp:Transcript_30510/g.62918  ORF Transcript_30510/g.62918 Transcript_30510/m.62918 type:complete len:346 (+) Transcript_30510:63-1100(+)